MLFWQGISFWFYFYRCEGAASPECPKAIVEGIIEEEEEEDEDDEEGGGSVNKRKKEDDTEVGSFLGKTQQTAKVAISSFPNNSKYNRQQLQGLKTLYRRIILLGRDT